MNEIRIASNLSELTGIGTEYLILNGEIVAKFWNGNIACDAQSGNTEKTITATWFIEFLEGKAS